MQPQATQRSLWNVLLAVLSAPRVVVALTTGAVGLLVLAIPELDAVRSELLVLLVTLVLVVVSGRTVQDAARLGREAVNRPDPAPEELKALVRLILLEVLDEIYRNVGEGQPNV